MRTRNQEPNIHEELGAIDQRIVRARQAAREAELSYRSGQEAIAAADEGYLTAQAAKAAGQPSEVAEAAKALERAKSEALPMRDLEIVRRALELVEQERVAFLASHVAEFERDFTARYGETAREVEDAEEAIVRAYARWREVNQRHFQFRQSLRLRNDDIPQTPPALRDTSKAIRAAREARAA
jgi:hypothetical protein